MKYKVIFEITFFYVIRIINMELINRNIITIAITSMLMSNTVSAKDLFVELESEKKIC